MYYWVVHSNVCSTLINFPTTARLRLNTCSAAKIDLVVDLSAYDYSVYSGERERVRERGGCDRYWSGWRMEFSLRSLQTFYFSFLQTFYFSIRVAWWRASNMQGTSRRNSLNSFEGQHPHVQKRIRRENMDCCIRLSCARPVAQGKRYRGCGLCKWCFDSIFFYSSLRSRRCISKEMVTRYVTPLSSGIHRTPSHENTAWEQRSLGESGPCTGIMLLWGWEFHGSDTRELFILF